MNRNRRNSGFSIMETVIALAIIVIVTLAALTVIMASISARIKASNYSEAQDFAHNALECFKAAENNGEFEGYLAFAGYYKDPVTNKYEFDNKFTLEEIKTDFVEGEFYIEITDNKGEEIISFSYTKGAQ